MRRGTGRRAMIWYRPRAGELVELSSGLLASAVGVSWFGYRLLVGIPGLRTTIDPSGGPSSAAIAPQHLASIGLLPMVAVSLMLLASIGVGTGACIHSQQASKEPFGLLWLST